MAVSATQAARWQRAYRARHPDRYAARETMRHHVRFGHIARPVCESCGSDERVHAHHDDYADPISIAWLCRKCHEAHHHKSPLAECKVRQDITVTVFHKAAVRVECEQRESFADRELVQRFVRRLPRVQRFAIELRFWYGCSLDEIAWAISPGITRQRAQQIIASGLKTVRDSMEPHIDWPHA